jgi:predicted small metal-binding protein
MAGCSFVAKAPNEADLMKQVAAHAATVHNIKDFTPDLLAKVKAKIKDVA